MKKKPKIQKWEYGVLEKEAPVDADTIDQLKEYGDDGYELVAVTRDVIYQYGCKGDRYVYIFKRPIND